MSKHICFFSTSGSKPEHPEFSSANSNHLLLPAAFKEAGWRVSVFQHAQLRLEPQGISIGEHATECFDLIWLLGFGAHADCLDRFQILSQLPNSQFVTPPLTMLRLHAKFALYNSPIHPYLPESWVSSDLHWLMEKISEGGEWVVKPTAGSFGKNVHRVSSTSPDLQAILNRILKSSACLLQAYLREIEAGEKRILIANAKILGSYLRTSSEQFRTNLSKGSMVSTCSLTEPQSKVIKVANNYLAALGIRFAAIDLVGEQIMEINIANPGGLHTLNQLYKKDFARLTALSFL